MKIPTSSFRFSFFKSLAQAFKRLLVNSKNKLLLDDFPQATGKKAAKLWRTAKRKPNQKTTA